MTRLTPLETSVLDALADELGDQLPDLPGQIAESLVGVRRNTGSGFFTEVIVDRARPSPDAALTGRFGTIHGDVPGLIEPMAFQVDVSGGRLMALHGSTYGEATDRIDFLVAPVSGLFRIDEQGESVAIKPRISMIESPLRDLQKWHDPTQPAVPPPPSAKATAEAAVAVLLNKAADRATPSPTAQAALDALFGQRSGPSETPAATAEDQTSLVIGLVVLIIVIGLFAVVFLNVPTFFVLIMGGYLISALMRPKGRAGLRKAVDLYKAVRASQRP